MKERRDGDRKERDCEHTQGISHLLGDPCSPMTMHSMRHKDDDSLACSQSQEGEYACKGKSLLP